MAPIAQSESLSQDNRIKRRCKRIAFSHLSKGNDRGAGSGEEDEERISQNIH